MVRIKKKNFVSAVIYVHNVEAHIGCFLQTIIHVLEENFEHSEIICVNDGSDDNSLSELRKTSMPAGSTSISVINLSYYHGLEAAMNAGLDLAIGDFVFEFDNTILDFDENEIMRIYERSLEGYDIVSASPNRKERLSSKLFYSVFEKFTNVPHRMITESFRVLSRRVINRVSSTNKTIPYRKAVYANSGLKTDNILYDVLPDAADAVKNRKENRYRKTLAFDTLILFTEVGYRFSIAMTLLMMATSVFMVCYSIVIYMTRHPVVGWTTTILFLSVAFSGLFGILTIVIKYLQLLVNLVFKRKQYVFESIEKLTK